MVGQPIAVAVFCLGMLLPVGQVARAGRIHTAAEQGDLARVRALLEADPAPVNARDFARRTPLHHAATRGHSEVVQVLLDKGADVNAVDRWKMTPLHLAAGAARDPVAQILIAHGADVNAADDLGLTPLHLAAGNGHLSTVQLLVSEGAFVAAQDKEGGSPAVGALRWDHAAIAEYLSSPGAATRGRSLEELAADLHSDNATTRTAAAHALGVLNDPRALQPLAQAIRDPDPGVRERATHSLGAFNDAEAVPALLDAIRDDNAIVRRTAADALGTYTEDPRATRALTTAATDRDPNVRKQAVTALRESGDPEALDVLLHAVRDPDCEVRIAAVEALRQSRDPRATSALIAALADRNVAVRFHALLALKGRSDPPVLDALSAAADRDPSDVPFVADALARAGDPRAVPLLLRSYRDGASAKVVDPAYAAVLAMGDAAMEPLLTELNRGTDPQEVIVSLLGDLGDVRAYGPLTRSLARKCVALQPKPDRPSFLERVFGKLVAVIALPAAIAADIASNAPPDGELAPRVLDDILDTAPRVEGGYAHPIEGPTRPWLEALEKVERRATAWGEGKLIQDLQNPYPGVREGSALLLRRFTDSEARDALAEALGDPEAHVRLAALHSLGARGRDSLDLLSRMLCDPVPDVRVAAVCYLRACGADEAVRPDLERALSDDDPDVRIAAARALLAFGEPGTRLVGEALARETNDRARRAMQRGLEGR